MFSDAEVLGSSHTLDFVCEMIGKLQLNVSSYCKALRAQAFSELVRSFSQIKGVSRKGGIIGNHKNRARP